MTAANDDEPKRVRRLVHRRCAICDVTDGGVDPPKHDVGCPMLVKDIDGMTPDDRVAAMKRERDFARDFLHDIVAAWPEDRPMDPTMAELVRRRLARWQLQKESGT